MSVDVDDLALEVRSLRRQVESLTRRLADRPAVNEALPLRKVAPLIGFSVGLGIAHLATDLRAKPNPVGQSRQAPTPPG